MSKKILVIGSSNTDMVVNTKNFPEAGQTVMGNKFFINPGGKGANQAVAAARLGGDVTFLAKIGQDAFGKESILNMTKENIDMSHVVKDNENPSGIALITLNEQGENTIVVAPGSNSAFTIQEILNAEDLIREADIILLQLEIPIAVVSEAVEIAKKHGKKIILNPAPAAEIPENILQGLTCLTPNLSEAIALTGHKIESLEDVEVAADILLAKGVETIIITTGASGAFVKTKDCSFTQPAFKAKVKDTTAAGDIFNGAFAVALSNDYGLEKAVEFGAKAAALSVSREGAQASAPYLREINQ